MSKLKAVICDLDNTLCDASHRMEYFKLDSRKFVELIPSDSPNLLIGSFLQYLRFRGYILLFVSARAEDTRLVTRAWLANHFPGFEGYPLFLRGRYDERFDDEVKREIYVNQIEPDYDVKLVLDDRSHVVNMWRQIGLQCWQVAEGNY